jgi:hypothetical protein
MGGLFIVAVVLTDAVVGMREPFSALYQTAGRPIQVAEGGLRIVRHLSCLPPRPIRQLVRIVSSHDDPDRHAATVKADFNATRVADVQGQPMVLERRGDEFWAEFDDPDRHPFSTAPARVTRQVGDDYRLTSSAGVLGIAPAAAA